MRPPAFWWRTPPTLASRLLWPVGVLVGETAARRMARPGTRMAVPVICVGNFVAGGAGKTPTAITLARFLLSRGERPFFLTRGYGGSQRTAPIIVDPQRHSASEVGDEPLLLARQARTIVAGDRVAAAKIATAEGASVLIMDDGLQSRRLEPDLALAVVDGEAGVGNGYCLPAGPLRAPLKAQLKHVGAVIVIGERAAGAAVASAARARAVPVIRAELVPDPEVVGRLRRRPVLAFAGIGRPEKFFTTLARAGIEVAAQEAFPDHHRYSLAEIDELSRRAAPQGLSLVTTEKDAVRLPSGASCDVLPVTVAVDLFEPLATLVAAAIENARLRRFP